MSRFDTIKLDTNSMYSFANRLEKINVRLGVLDQQLDAFYLKVGLVELINLAASDSKIAQSNIIRGCVSYLRDTAADFERLEKSLVFSADHASGTVRYVPPAIEPTKTSSIGVKVPWLSIVVPLMLPFYAHIAVPVAVSMLFIPPLWKAIASIGNTGGNPVKTPPSTTKPTVKPAPSPVNTPKETIIDMPNKLNQKNYEEPIKSVGCSATAWAMVMSWKDGKQHNPFEYWGPRGATWSGGQSTGGSEAEVLRKAYDCVSQGKPCVVGKDPAHYVCVNGINPGADPSNLKRADFIVVDPGDGQQKNFADAKIQEWENDMYVDKEINQIIIPN